jgi:hypothetical protein
MHSSPGFLSGVGDGGRGGPTNGYGSSVLLGGVSFVGGVNGTILPGTGSGGTILGSNLDVIGSTISFGRNCSYGVSNTSCMPKTSIEYTGQLKMNPYRFAPPLSSMKSLDGQRGIPDTVFIGAGRFFCRSCWGLRRLTGCDLLGFGKNPQTRFFAVRSHASGASSDRKQATFQTHL